MEPAEAVTLGELTLPVRCSRRSWQNGSGADSWERSGQGNTSAKLRGEERCPGDQTAPQT